MAFPALERRLAYPGRRSDPDPAPFADLLERGPIIAFRSRARGRQKRKANHRRSWPDPLLLAYVGLLLLAGLVGYWWGG